MRSAELARNFVGNDGMYRSESCEAASFVLFFPTVSHSINYEAFKLGKISLLHCW